MQLYERKGLFSQLAATSGRWGFLLQLGWFVCLFVFHLRKPSLDPVCLTARSWQESWQGCAEESQQLHFCAEFLRGQEGMSLLLLFLALCSAWEKGAGSCAALTEGRQGMMDTIFPRGN